MPNSPAHPCSQPGCAALISAGRFCEKHAKSERNSSRLYDQYTRKLTPSLAQAAAIRNTSRWQKVRAMHKALFPLCCDPLRLHPNITAYNQQSHHILPLATHPELAFDLDNLGPTCWRCHAAIEAKERSGESTAHFFTATQ